jgi:hypothetical protein
MRAPSKIPDRQLVKIQPEERLATIPELDLATILVLTTLLLALISTLPVMASAQTTGAIKINEIMYNPPGADTNHEWLELCNNDTKDINITGWKFYEADANHRLTPVQGSMIIPVNGYAIIADDATTFLNEHPECNCTVIDSTFSLSNTGEYIALKNATLDLIDEVTYTDSWGADGNGRTLELNATGGWEESYVDGGTPCQRNSVIWICGDVNCDGKVTMSDVQEVFNRYLDPNYPLDLPWAADVNCDGKVMMSDVRKVFNRYLDPGYELNCCCEM